MAIDFGTLAAYDEILIFLPAALGSSLRLAQGQAPLLTPLRSAVVTDALSRMAAEGEA